MSEVRGTVDSILWDWTLAHGELPERPCHARLPAHSLAVMDEDAASFDGWADSWEGPRPHKWQQTTWSKRAFRRRRLG